MAKLAAMLETSPTTGPTRLHGRRDEIMALDSCIRALRRGRGGVVLLEGAPGSGKTRLIDEAALRARRDGVRFLRGSAEAAAGGTPLAPLLDALSGCGGPPVSRPTSQEAKCASNRPAVLVARVQRQLEQACVRTPLVVALDDLHNGDDETLLAVRALSARLTTKPILWIVTLSPGRANTTARALTRAGATVLHLAPLNSVAIRGLARDVLGCTPAEAVFDLIDDLDGHPMFVIELLRGLVDEGVVEVTSGRARLTGQGLRRALGELGLRRPPARRQLHNDLGLTKSELAVVELVAQGATNRQAAERLFLSPHTVSTHLRHTFEKLGIRSRVELAILFAEHRPAIETSRGVTVRSRQRVPVIHA
jgi:DNA-binding CsgD family transcriptional regulator/predicted ATPase